MEDSPITLAHTHARNAVLETRRSNPVAASEEHDLAAAEFAHAAQSTHDAEALRTLSLLEEHHKKLGQILKFRHEHPQAAVKLESHDNVDEGKSKQKGTEEPAEDTSKHLTGLDALQQPPRLARGTRATARDLSSSIASNLASARGIPGGHRRGMPASPTISAQHVPGKFAKDQAKAKGVQETSRASKLQSDFFNSNDRSHDGKPSWAPPNHVTNEEPAKTASPAAESVASTSDAPFQQFYHTLESLMSKLTAPLAFAGLPLTSNAKPTAPSDNSAESKKPSPSAPEKDLDYSQMISKAALRAVQDGQPASANPAESFYVVPTTGGTTSYADIMTRADRTAASLRHTRHLSNLSEDNMEDFVDAKETLQPATTTKDPQSPDLRKLNPSSSQPHKNNHPAPPQPNQPHLLEELTLTNTYLKQTIDKLSKRLHIFEASAQSSSAALAYSIRSLTTTNHNNDNQPTSSPLGTPENSAGKPSSHPNTDEKAAKRIAELEEILRKSDRELARREKENVKLNENLRRYRDKWESLKKGAKARREGVSSNGNGKGEDAMGIE
ncbi:hypothetical protein EPUS_06570 [Endocarpon pusillum Z07020]|uniref:Uncharacterized protein n=1 Tax=Endocarpon pusillum (strain Z07020 / HMAS-L-300199) TaxID=1263415 RepID=U1HUW1_ENDPU|nr:uncharacterized protein EPUS_06570 [Endocarpon pusillum Z07020]ERF73109.1 hypothetical protein EPUS_06570 [Endocarpon pusillum Z07020]